MNGRSTFCATALATALATGLAIACLTAGGGQAWAHAALLETQPADGAVLAAAPGEVMLRFDEPVSPIALRVVDPRGAAVPLPAPPHAEGDRLRLTLPARLAAGSYTVSYRVTSVDSHPVAGAFVFHIGAATRGAAPATAETSNRLVTAADLALRTTMIGAVLLAAGAALFAAGVAPLPPTLDRVLPAIALIGALAAFVSIATRGALLADLPASGALGAEAWRLGLASTHAVKAIVVAVGLGMVAASRCLAPRIARRLGLLGALVAVASAPLSGHVASAEPRWLTVPTLAVHATCVALWAGSLWPLALVITRSPPAEALRVVRRFSRLAVPAVALLLASGTIISAVQLGAPLALATTPYGRVLALKLMLVAGLLLLAAHNRRRLTPALAQGRDGAAGALVRAIRLEGLLMAGAVLAVAVLGSLPPPRVLHAQARAELTLTAHAGEAAAAIAIQPGRAGSNTIRLRLTGTHGAPLVARAVSVALANPGAGIEPIERHADVAGDGAYVVQDAPLSVPGRWSLRIDALITDFDKIILETEAEIP